MKITGEVGGDRSGALAHGMRVRALLAAFVLVASMFADPTTAAGAPLSRYGQKGIVLQIFGNGETKIGEPMQMEVYVDRGVAPESVPREIALFDAPYIRVWQPAGGGNTGGGRIVRSDTANGTPGWAFIGTRAGNVRLVVTYGPFTTAAWIRVTDGGWNPIGVTLRKSQWANTIARENEDLGLEAWVDYEGVDPKMVGQTRRQGDDRIFTWTVEPPASGGTGTVRDYGGPKFKATKPGEYLVTARYGPFISNKVKIRVYSRYAGTYKGALQVAPVPGTTPRLSDIEFTVNEFGEVKGAFHWGMTYAVAGKSTQIEYSGEFAGWVDEKGRFFSDDVPSTLSMGDLVSPEARAVIGRGGSVDGVDDPILRQQLLDLQQKTQEALGTLDGLGNLSSVSTLTFRIEVGGGIQRADGTLDQMAFSASGNSFTE